MFFNYILHFLTFIFYVKTPRLYFGFKLEVFKEDTRPEDPGTVWVWIYILNGQLGPGRIPIYYFASRVYFILCVIPESIRKHRSR